MRDFSASLWEMLASLWRNRELISASTKREVYGLKKVVFTLKILPAVTLLSALFHGLISHGVWLLAYLVFFGLPRVTALYLPLIVRPFAMFILGLSWALASLGVFLRDVWQLIGVVTATLMFLNPIFYPATALPEGYRHWLYLNPLTPVLL